MTWSTPWPCCFACSLARSARNGVPRSRIRKRQQCGNASSGRWGSMLFGSVRALGRRRVCNSRHRWVSSSNSAVHLRQVSTRRCARRSHGIQIPITHGRIRLSARLRARLGTGACTTPTTDNCARCSRRSTRRCSTDSPVASRLTFRRFARCRQRSGRSRQSVRQRLRACRQRLQKPLACSGFRMASRTNTVLNPRPAGNFHGCEPIAATDAAALPRPGGDKGEVKEPGLARFLAGGCVFKSLIGMGITSPAGVGAGHGDANHSRSAPPPPKSRCPNPDTPYLVEPRKNGGGPGEGQKKIGPARSGQWLRRRPGGPSGGTDGTMRVLRVLLSAR